MGVDNLSERKLNILKKTIEDYIEDAQPITSGGVHKKHLKDVSPATLRNELSALEGMGYLKQIHTSSGRVPTTKAYRLYVNELMQADFDEKSLGIIKQMFEKRAGSLEEVVHQIAKTVSKATNYPTVVVLNGFDKLTIHSIKIIPVIGSKAIVLINTSTGIVNNVVDITSNITEQICMDASVFLTKHFKGRTIADMILNIKGYEKQMNEELTDYKNIFHLLTDCLVDLSSTHKTRLASEGKVKLLNEPEYEDLISAKKVLNLLSNEEELKHIFKREDVYKDISFKIGNENEHNDLENCGVITANYTINGNNIASINIIGPKRMKYNKVAAALRYIVSELTLIKRLPNSTYKDEEN